MEHIINFIKNSAREKNKNEVSGFSMHCVGCYTILCYSQTEFNDCNLSIEEKYENFFNLDNKTAKKVIDFLTEIGVIIQKYEKQKLVISPVIPENN